MKVRTRVAPSPTGDPHVGTAYMALFCLCFARQHGGEFILRIEDTDAARSTTAAEKLIFDSLKWLGLQWDEGPDVGGDFGPYRQSERVNEGLYQKYADQLVDKGQAFHCFCSTVRLDEMRAEQNKQGQSPQYDGLCMSLTATEVEQRLANSEPNVIRLKVPTEGCCIIKDKLRGDIEIDWAQVDMQVLVKTDGNPTYHLAVVVDDHLMQISHIIRGEEWISSAPKHILLHQYFGWDMPELIHMPLLRNPDKSKLSKRKNPTSINFYQRMGFLPEALLNYLGMLGWSLPSGEEKFSLQTMIDNFNIERISLGAPVFDVDKLTWLNGRWLREELTDEQFAERISNWAFNRENLLQIIPLLKERVDVFSEFAPKAAFFVSGMPDISIADFEFKKVAIEDVAKILQIIIWQTDKLAQWDRDVLEQLLGGVAEQLELKIRDVLAPVFIAVTGASVAPPLFDSMVILGPDMVRARLRYALAIVGGISKKKLKKLDKEYRLLFDS
ncbi:MAG: glutamate--tRNA ligase [Pseudomonadales bacterium]|nr:glutamate--tRNA ligase [Pseudomonadales bacterium]